MKRLLILAQLPGALMVLYLDLLSVAAMFWRRTATEIAPRSRFAVLVPAHDEEQLLPRLLDSLAALDYPRDLYDVHVVADNCSDRTAVVAAQSGAIVHERHDTELRGKGHALHWLLSRLRGASRHNDAYVILDADSVASPNFLSVMNAHLARGDEAIQCYYGVLNLDESPSSALRHIALALYNGLRPRGRDALGLSAGLRGNGMCFASKVIDRFGWDAFTLAEDAEFHLRLVDGGVKVAYAADATVLAEMPTTLRQSHSQNLRWERGRLEMLRTYGTRLLIDGARRRDPARLDAVAEQLVPPLSVLTGYSLGSLALAILLRARDARRLATVVFIGQVVYVAVGMRLVRAGRNTYAALIFAPFYVVWKIWLYVAAAAGRGERSWVRTQRRKR